MRITLLPIVLFLVACFAGEAAADNKFWCTDLSNNVDICEPSKLACMQLARRFDGSFCEFQEAAVCYTYDTLRAGTKTHNVSCHRTEATCLTFRARTFIPSAPTTYVNITPCVLVE